MSNSIQSSERLFDRSKKIAPGGVHSPVRGFRGVGGTPRFIESAAGAELVDVDGNRYIDFCMSWGPLLFGHRDPEVHEAVQSALSRGWSFGATEPYSLELAEFMHSRIPWLERVRFVNSGTEAVMSALRVARAATGRNLILKFDGCYHGHVDSMLVRAGSGLAEMASPDSAGVSPHTASETLVAPLDDTDAVEAIFEARGSEIAALIIEPLPANNGLLKQKPDTLEKIARMARAAGSLVIFDEVISGFRVAFGGMAELTGIRPDLVTYGKVIGAGFPVGAYGGREDLMKLVAPEGPVYQAGTLSANPVAMVAGLAMLKKIDREKPFAELQRKTDHLASYIESEVTLRKNRGEAPFVECHLQTFGSLFWPVLGKVTPSDGIVRSIAQTPSSQKEAFAKVFHASLDRGIYLAPSGYEVGFMATVHTDEHLRDLAGALADALCGE